LTLYDERNAFTNFMEVIKPYLKFATTVDFGKATFKNEFHEYLKDHKLAIAHSERCHGNLLLKLAKFYIYETEVSQ
jgi:hypothetical protein